MGLLATHTLSTADIFPSSKFTRVVERPIDYSSFYSPPSSSDTTLSAKSVLIPFTISLFDLRPGGVDPPLFHQPFRVWAQHFFDFMALFIPRHPATRTGHPPSSFVPTGGVETSLPADIYTPAGPWRGPVYRVPFVSCFYSRPHSLFPTI